MNALTRALKRCESVQLQAAKTAQKSFAAGGPTESVGALDSYRETKRVKNQYSQYTGWIYSAIHAIALEAAKQPIKIGRSSGSSDFVETDEDERRVLPTQKQFKMPEQIKQFGTNIEMIDESDQIYRFMEQPNGFQSQWVFLYNLITNIHLTGWAYVVVDYEKKVPYFYSVPTNWITPDHSKKPFGSYNLVDPSNPKQTTPVKAENVGCAYLPNPANPMASIAPISSQLRAVNIDNYIQTSQEAFFENGIFPSVVVKIGTNPHPDVPAGLRPQLTANQRRQVTNAIRKVMTGVHNYGNPAIVDGMIEGIERLSATSNEMGWEKSEEKIRTRILSSLGVHPFILGEPVSVGGFAQAFVIKEQFCGRVNTFLGMISQLMTRLCKHHIDPDLVVWYETCEPKDPSIDAQNMRAARKQGDIGINEFRAYMDLPPVEEPPKKDPLLSTVGGLTSVMTLMTLLGQGQISSTQGQVFLKSIFGFDDATAKALAGTSAPASAPASVDEPEKAMHALTDAIRILKTPTQQILSEYNSKRSDCSC